MYVLAWSGPGSWLMNPRDPDIDLTGLSLWQRARLRCNVFAYSRSHNGQYDPRYRVWCLRLRVYRWELCTYWSDRCYIPTPISDAQKWRDAYAQRQYKKLPFLARASCCFKASVSRKKRWEFAV